MKRDRVAILSLMSTAWSTRDSENQRGTIRGIRLHKTAQGHFCFSGRVSLHKRKRKRGRRGIRERKVDDKSTKETPKFPDASRNRCKFARPRAAFKIFNMRALARQRETVFEIASLQRNYFFNLHNRDPENLRCSRKAIPAGWSALIRNIFPVRYHP